MKRFKFSAWLGWMLLLACHLSEAQVAFVDVWERSMPQLDSACRDEGITASFYRSSQFTALGEKEAATFALVMVLNIDVTESPKLTDLLKKAAALNPRQLVLPLDARGSHVDLEKASILTRA
jgi:cobaltochelatase CobN